MKRYIVIILFLCACVPGQSAYNPAKTALLIRKLAQTKEDTSRISLQIQIGESMLLMPFPKSRQDSARYFLTAALQLSVKLHEPDWQHDVLKSMAKYYYMSNDTVLADQCYRQVIDYYHQKGNLEKEADAWMALFHGYLLKKNPNERAQQKITIGLKARGIYLQNRQFKKAAAVLSDIANQRTYLKQYELAEKDLQQSLAEYKAAGETKLQYTYMTLVDLEYTRGNFYRAIAHCVQGIKSTAPGEEILYTSFFYWTAAKSNFAVKNYEETLTWLSKAMETFKEHQDYKFLHIQTLLALNKIEEAGKAIDRIIQPAFSKDSWDTLHLYLSIAQYHAKKRDTEEAVHYFLKTLERAKILFVGRTDGWLTKCYNGIAEAYLNNNQAPKSEDYIKQTEWIVKNSSMPLDPGLLIDHYNNAYRYDTATGQYKSSVKNLELRVALEDSIFAADKEKQLAELNIQYETSQKELSIKNLQNQTTAQRATLKTARLQRNITIAGIFIMILVSALFYRNYQLKKQANQTITHKNERLQHLVNEKDWLVKEIHHRVKNNLQTVMGLLGTQSYYLKSEEAINAMTESQHRIQSMSLIHQRLYQSNNLSSIGMNGYIHELINSLSEGFNTDNRVRFNIDVAPITLDLAHAIPLGLIINEAITNAFKYAFPGNRPGLITVALKEDPASNISLSIHDNGVGLGPGFDARLADTMGMNLMRGLCSEIGAQCSITNQGGTLITVHFAYAAA